MGIHTHTYRKVDTDTPTTSSCEGEMKKHTEWTDGYMCTHKHIDAHHIIPEAPGCELYR